MAQTHDFNHQYEKDKTYHSTTKRNKNYETDLKRTIAKNINFIGADKIPSPISPSTALRILEGNTSCSIISLFNIAKETNTSMDFLCGLRTNKEKTDILTRAGFFKKYNLPTENDYMTACFESLSILLQHKELLGLVRVATNNKACYYHQKFMEIPEYAFYLICDYKKKTGNSIKNIDKLEESVQKLVNRHNKPALYNQLLKLIDYCETQLSTEQQTTKLRDVDSDSEPSDVQAIEDAVYNHDNKSEKDYDYSSYVAENVAKRLSDLGFSKKKLESANYAFSKTAASTLMNGQWGKRGPKAATLYKICKKDNISMDYLCGLSNYPRPHDDVKLSCLYPKGCIPCDINFEEAIANYFGLLNDKKETLGHVRKCTLNLFAYFNGRYLHIEEYTKELEKEFVKIGAQEHYKYCSFKKQEELQKMSECMLDTDLNHFISKNELFSKMESAIMTHYEEAMFTELSLIK